MLLKTVDCKFNNFKPQSSHHPSLLKVNWSNKIRVASYMHVKVETNKTKVPENRESVLARQTSRSSRRKKPRERLARRSWRYPG